MNAAAEKGVPAPDASVESAESAQSEDLPSAPRSREARAGAAPGGDPALRRAPALEPAAQPAASAEPGAPPRAVLHGPMTSVAASGAPAARSAPCDDREATPGPIGLLLHAPAEVARRCLNEEGLRSLTLAALGTLALGAAAFGGVVGSFRGGEQILYGAVKVPLAMFAALVVCVPAFSAIAASLGRPWPLRTIIALTVGAAGRAGLVLLAFAPVLWLAYDLGLGYHAAALAATGSYAMAGLAALGVLLRGLGDAKHRAVTAAAFVAVFLAAAGQTGWLLRPYLVRPQTEEVPFVRAREGSFADALYVSARSAIGIYDSEQVRSVATGDRWAVECPAESMPPEGWPPGSRCARAPHASDEIVYTPYDGAYR